MNQRNLIIAGAVGIVIVGLVAGFLLTRGGEKKEVVPTPTPTPEIVVELLPSDALSVSLKRGSGQQYVLTIDEIPEGVTGLSYEITYDTKNKGMQGIVGSPVTLKSGQTKYTNDKIIFGTCSGSKCVYDEGVSNIEVNIRLTYSDGSEKGWKGTLEI